METAEVVISGMAGVFPESWNLTEFREKLLAGEDMVSDDDSKWPRGNYCHATIGITILE